MNNAIRPYVRGRRHNTTHRKQSDQARSIADYTAETVTPLFDVMTNDDIEALAASIGATGARRPASE